MILREIRLENVKSYGSPAETIRLARGVNAISGQNGAGKSTVLEAIGATLFQYLPYRQEVFVREGESTGTIAVVVDSRLDGRTYEIVRRVGKGATQYVFDPDLGQQIARGEADVGRWLRQHLGVDGDVDLKSLFLDTVGPPQGTLTAAFLEAATVRRAKFNRLLRVEEYEEAFKKLSSLESAIESERRDLKLKIAILEGQTKGRSDLELRHAVKRDEQASLGIRLGRLTAERESLDRVLADFEEASRRWNAARSALDLAAERERNALAVAIRAREEVGAAREAAATCARTRSARDTYIRLEIDLMEQERRRLERDRLRDAKHDLDLQQNRLRSDLDRLGAEIQRCEQAARRIAELEAKIPEQDAAEVRLSLARDAMREIEDLRKRLAAIRDRGTRASDRFARSEKALDYAAGQRAIADDLDARRQRHEQTAGALVEINRAEGELALLRLAIQDEDRRVSSIRERFATLERQLREVATATRTLVPLVTIEARFREVTEERASASSRLGHAESTRTQVADGLCPFLREPCRNLRPGVTLDSYFEGETREWSAKLARINGDFTLVERQLLEARTIEQRRATAEQWQIERDSLAPELQAAQGRLTELSRRFQAATAVASRRTETGRNEQYALAAMREAERAVLDVSRLPDLEKEVDDAREELTQARAEWLATRDRLGNSDAIEAELRLAAAAADAVGRPREAVAHFQADAARLSSLLLERDDLAAKLETTKQQAVQHDEALAHFSDLDRKIDELRTARETLRPRYEEFIAAVNLAENLDARVKVLDEAEGILVAARDVSARARHEVDRAAEDYDETHHQASRRRRAELDAETGQVRAQIEHASDEIARLDNALAEIGALESQLSSLRIAADRIEGESNLAGSIRQAIRATGPEITRRLLSGISRLATNINADILNQSGIELEWTADYDIVTRRQGESRGFAQLSGGEQMAAALAVRMAAMRLLSNVRVAFLDEPTAHLDQSRRANLGDQVQHLQGFDQLVVISHDDTFDGLFGHVVRITMQDGHSRVSDDG